MFKWSPPIIVVSFSTTGLADSLLPSEPKAEFHLRHLAWAPAEFSFAAISGECCIPFSFVALNSDKLFKIP